jgi:N-sulfoglucosamine sulfohydrolase
VLASVACESSERTRDRDAASSKPAPKPRNLLVLLSDDQSGTDLGCYGNRDVRTPNIDALAKGGLRCDRAYTAVGVCQPSRSSLFTGLYPIHHGAGGFEPIHSDVATWPELLRERDVATALIGKLDVDPIEKFPFDFLVKAKDMPSRRDPAGFAGYFREFLASAKDRRFAAVVAFHDPHRPFDEEMASTGGSDPSKLSVPGFLWDSPGVRTELAQYYDCIARLDRGVGMVLEVLREAGHGDDTLVVFTSDNGMAFPFAKSTLYEAGVRMPLVARGLGVRAGATDEFVSLIDLLPTALELFDAPPRALDGVSLLAHWRDGRSLGRDAIVTMQTENNREQCAPARALHARRFVYIRNFDTGKATVSNVVNHTLAWSSGEELARFDERLRARMTSYLYRPEEELYDLERDPSELTNLAGDAGAASTRDAMRAKLRGWMAANGDPLLEQWTE